eukprot:552821-Amphidinium_carterae.1
MNPELRGRDGWYNASAPEDLDLDAGVDVPPLTGDDIEQPEDGADSRHDESQEDSGVDTAIDEPLSLASMASQLEAQIGSENLFGFYEDDDPQVWPDSTDANEWRLITAGD